jgi:hypothetical protein
MARKIVISRKGVDSKYGAAASPILMPDGEMWSIPVPENRGANHSTTKYGDIMRGSRSMGPIVAALTRGKLGPDHYAHFDPDLAEGSLPRRPGWKGLFGQGNRRAFTHLNKRHGVGVQDVFLFYGSFRHVDMTPTGYKYRSGSPVLHVFFGWLQVASQVSPVHANATLPWARYHPNCMCPDDRDSLLQFIYVSDRLNLPGMTRELPGAGFFRKYHDELRLTLDGETKSVWRLPSWIHPSGGCRLSCNEKDVRWSYLPDGSVRLESADIGQEFVLTIPDGLALKQA